MFTGIGASCAAGLFGVSREPLFHTTFKKFHGIRELLLPVASIPLDSYLNSMLTSPDSSLSDASLAARIQAGDRVALEQIYRQHAGAVYRYALALGGNSAWAADATHEAFLQFALRPGSFASDRGSLAAYLCGIARFQLLALLREPVAGEREGDDGEEIGDTSCEPLALLVKRQSTEALLAALRKLPLVFRETVILVDLQECDYADAARIAGVPLNTLRTRLHRARRRLAELLGAATPNLSERTHDVSA